MANPVSPFVTVPALQADAINGIQEIREFGNSGIQGNSGEFRGIH
jgi:hypothetical protein